MSSATPSPTETLDVRLVPCAGKHELIFHRWSELAVGGDLVLINDHRPEPLRRQFEQMLGGCYVWEEIESPADGFAVKLTRLRPDPVGFDPTRIGGCGLLAGGRLAGGRGGLSAGGDEAFDDSILVVLQRDYRELMPTEARERVLRLAARLPAETALWVDLNGPDPALDTALTELGCRIRGSALMGATPRWRYAIRQPEAAAAVMVADT
ncbi:DUF2249 domain-containing protein [Actomonas aquatica]|uniref:DUF2249 domain-containing protein n=1 Tax=Actomonas aquatica TaxID=2866162 RepID=A0ABZ1C5Q9_9BACT|nr:DUF2249 domain-containing protein [Opitutus sp. WL0086]WRQ86573.1 DUF2249 domain-containing protein [Opitutus sp. WL0086]